MKTRFSCKKSFFLKFLCAGILSVTVLLSVPFVTSCGSKNKSVESAGKEGEEVANNRAITTAASQLNDDNNRFDRGNSYRADSEDTVQYNGTNSIVDEADEVQED